jgi:hypothetical protein
MWHHFSLEKVSSSPFIQWFGLIIALVFVSMPFGQRACAQTNQATIAWNADTGAVAGYDVYWGTSSGNYTSNSKVGNVTTATLQNLTSPAYYIAITAYDSSGDQSGYSPELIIYSLTASAGTGGSISPSGTFFQSSGASQTFTITPASGYQVASVQVDGVSVGAVSTYTLSDITASHTVSATFASQTATTYTINASAGSNGTISPSGSVSASSGSTKQFTVTPSSGCTASVGGTCGGTLSGNTYTTNAITANCTVTASFAASSYTITATAGSGGSISPSGTVKVASGSKQTFTITPATNYNISSVSVDGKSVGALSSYTFSNVAANHTIAASFARGKHTILATAQGSGSVSPSGTVSVSTGASQTFTNTPSSGYKVADVSVDGVSAGAVTAYKFSNITANHTITASFVTAEQPPAADAGPDQTVAAGTEVTLCGLNSTDPGGPGIKSYKWTQTGGTSVTLSSSSSGKPSFKAPDQQGALTFQLTATDKKGLQSTGTCIVNIVTSDADVPPTASAGPDQTVGAWTIVTLDGTKSSASSGDIYSYLWQQIDGPTVTLSDQTSSQATFIAPQDPSGSTSLSFMLTITDSYGFKSIDICYVNVTLAGSAPEAAAGPNRTATAGSVVRLKGSNSTASNGIASFRWHQASGRPEVLSNPNTADPVFTAREGGTYGSTQTFRLTVQDAAGLRSKAAEVLTVH